MKESEFISALRSFATTAAARGLNDDAAVLEIGGEALILTHDAMVEGRHWLAGQDMADVAWKLVAVNLSDLAAKGAEPLGVLIGHTLGDGDGRFIEGLREVLAEFDVPLLGGDTVAGNGARTLGCTAIGRAAFAPVPSRSGAQPGDTLWVAGKIGAAMLGFESLRDKTGGDSLAYRRPWPLLEEGLALAPRVSAMMDVSDGLLLDAARMADASGVTLEMDTTHLDVADRSRLLECLTWGDDYALLFACDAKSSVPLTASPVGTVVCRSEYPILIDGEPPEPGARLGYQHG